MRLLIADGIAAFPGKAKVTPLAAGDPDYVGSWPRASTVCQDLRLKMRSAQACTTGTSTPRSRQLLSSLAQVLYEEAATGQPAQLLSMSGDGCIRDTRFWLENLERLK
jgi:hypothetical protein